MSARVLVVEDSLDLAAGLRYNLELEGFAVRVAEDGRSALRDVREWGPDLILLDLMLPDVDGFQVLQTIRGEGVRTPVLVLTARAEEADKVRGFRLDADQYVTKPFALLELLERVRSLLRRHAPAAEPAASDLLRFGEVVVDTASRTVTVRDEPVTLTPKAFELMLALVKRRGAVATRVELLREVWQHQALVMTRTVDSHVVELRKKLERDPAHPRHFVTVWKVGYRFQP